MDISRNHLAKDPGTLKDFSEYLESKNSLTEMVIFHKLAFSHLHAWWLAQLGRQPNRLRIICDKNQTFVEYNVKVIMEGKERVVIQVQYCLSYLN